MGMGRDSWDLCGSCAGGIVRRAGAVRPFVDGRATRPWVLALVAIVSCVLMVASCAGGIVRRAGAVRPFVDGRATRPWVLALVAIVSCVLMVAAAAMPVSAMAVPTVLEAPEQQTGEILADGSARVDGASIGIIGFERLAKGTARAAEGAPEGYRLPISDSAGLVVVRAPDEVLLHVDREVAARFDLEDPSGAARVDGASFGIIGFERLAKGTARASEGAPEGYRLPISDSAGLVVVRAPGEALLHVDREVAATFDLEDPSGAGLSALWSMACALDEAGSMGGALLSEGEVPLRLVTDSECVSGAFRYRFDARGDDGARYVTVTLANAEEGEAGLDAARAAGVDLGDGVLWWPCGRWSARSTRPAAWAAPCSRREKCLSGS